MEKILHLDYQFTIDLQWFQQVNALLKPVCRDKLVYPSAWLKICVYCRGAGAAGAKEASPRFVQKGVKICYMKHSVLRESHPSKFDQNNFQLDFFTEQKYKIRKQYETKQNFPSKTLHFK